MSDPYWDDATRIAKKQRLKGLKEYGMRIEDNHKLTFQENVDMALEECIDLIYYLEHLKARFKEIWNDENS